ncbi:nitroreductase family protein [uncultured Desulfuromonas sp.]|uniref:nitroreductase family protein n=1 Tax=uncultured Desulfuromonas sp. TaxID=181013 RepID=UPI002623DE08|nr:nitroreductase family protein [uncultured Desulfuromonas sp.]
MSAPIQNTRRTESEVDSIFPDRWSPRALSPAPIPEEQLRMLFEAARWAPSCYNEQPWHFVYATSAEGRAHLGEALVEKNRQWALQAPLLMFILARRTFARGGKPNRHAPFDAGAAWMSLAIQARRLGLYAHAMAGFSVPKAFQVLGVAEQDYEIMAAVAVGRRADPTTLPEDLREMESPNDRKPLSEVAAEFRPGD